MTKLIFWLAGAIALIAAGWGLLENPGLVSIEWFGYVLETSVAFCLGLIFVFALAVYFILFPYRWVHWIKTKFEKKHSLRAKETLLQILINILCNNLDANTKLIKQYQKLTKDNTDVVLLLKALSNADTATYEELIKNPRTEQAGWQGLIKDHIKRGEIVKASEEVDQLMKKNSKAGWVLKEAFDLYVLNNEWKKALNCLDGLLKSKLITQQDYDYQRAVLLVKLNKGEQAFKLCPNLPAAAICAAKAKPKKAEKIYRLSWEKCPSFEVYQAYTKLFAKENSLSQYKHVLKLCEANPMAKINALVTADAAIKAKLWSEAKKELNGYLANYPLTTKVAITMARIEIEANHNMREAQKWIDKVPYAETSLDYVCATCGHKTDTWSASCPICNTFAGLKI